MKSKNDVWDVWLVISIIICMTIIGFFSGRILQRDLQFEEYKQVFQKVVDLQIENEDLKSQVDALIYNNYKNADTIFISKGVYWGNSDTIFISKGVYWGNSDTVEIIDLSDYESMEIHK